MNQQSFLFDIKRRVKETESNAKRFLKLSWVNFQGRVKFGPINLTQAVQVKACTYNQGNNYKAEIIWDRICSHATNIFLYPFHIQHLEADIGSPWIKPHKSVLSHTLNACWTSQTRSETMGYYSIKPATSYSDIKETCEIARS